MSCDTSHLPCPICSHVGAFNTVRSLRDRLIYVSTNALTCPVCQEEVSGLDKLTIHLFSHVELLFFDEKNPSELINIKKKNKKVVSAESGPKKSVIVSAKNSTPSSNACSPVKYVKICPKPPKLALARVPIISFPQENKIAIPQVCDPIKNSNHETKSISQSNEKQNQFTCDICGLKFSDKNIIEMHKKLVHNNTQEYLNITKFQCHLCPKQFKMRGSLMVHLRVAHFGFLTCDRESKSKVQSIEKNNQVEVKEDKIINLEKSDTKQWQCDVCKKFFTTKYFLKKHKRLHTGETPYACTQCNKTFTFQQSYHKHLLYHNDDKPHNCNFCGRAFKELSTLHNHQRIHTGEKPFSCETCGKCFRQRVSYLVHRRIHTGVMPYKCTACNKSFRYKVSQRTHKCLAQPPGTVVRQSGDLVEKLKIKYTSKYEHQEVVTNQISEISEANAELIRSGAELSLEDMESEHFKLIPELSPETHIEKPENTALSLTSPDNTFQICDDLFTGNFGDLINGIHDEDKNVPSPSEILRNLCLSKDEQNETSNDSNSISNSKNKRFNAVYTDM